MNREQWLASTDPAAMLKAVRDKVSPRKLRLFAAACCRLTPPSRRSEERWPRFLLAVGELEKSADGLEADHVLLNTFFHPDWDATTLAHWSAKGVKEAAALLRDIAGDPFEPVTLPTCRRCDGDGEAHGSDRPFDWHGSGTWPGPCPACEGRRWDAPWVTPQVLSLAQAAYEDRLPDGTLDPFRLALLADALEEAGCPTGGECAACGGEKDPSCTADGCEGGVVPPHPLLAHLRSPGPHYRGMWSLDTILGKE